jgi:putative ABC transport system substrate-binding protein
MKRREFIGVVISGTLCPVVINAQHGLKQRLIGVLMTQDPSDASPQAGLQKFRDTLQQLGWTPGRDINIEQRWGRGLPANYRKFAAELVAIGPDGSAVVAPLKEATQTVPIVFVSVADPVGAGLVASLSRPGGNITGFADYEYGIGAKWLELLMQVAPGLKRVAVIRDTAQPSGPAQFGSVQTAAATMGVEVTPIGVGKPEEIERAIVTFANMPNGGLIVTSTASVSVHRALFMMLARRHRLPAIYPFHYYVFEGGLLSYSADQMEQFERAAGYVHRILRGEKPGELPVQAPNKYEIKLNLRTAREMGLEIPSTLLARADEVIE